MKKNDYFIGECVDMTHDGKGIVKYQDVVYFVNGMITGEQGKIKVIKVLKNYSIARLIELTKESSQRVQPKCPIFKACGGCHLQHLSLKGQQDFKTKRVKDCLKRIGQCHVTVQECMMNDDPWYYRNKVQMPVGYQNNHLVTGFYKQRTNDIIPTNNCMIQNKESNNVINRTRELLEHYQIKPYDKTSKKGNIKHIVTKYGYHSHELMLIFITFEKTIPHIQEITEILIKEFPHLKTIIQNINDRVDNVILGEKEKILYGPGFIEDTLLGNTYQISLKSFYQINPIQTEKLYSTAIELAQLNKDDVVLDAYCGIGTITLSLAKYVKKVYGVEIVEQAIIDAKNNAQVNHIDNVHFTCDDAGQYMISMLKEKKKLDCVFVDPPRKGCSQEFIEALIESKPPKIIYISCDVSTQARDIKILQEHGYKAEYCQPVDMFPQTSHVENIVKLSLV